MNRTPHLAVAAAAAALLAHPPATRADEPAPPASAVGALTLEPSPLARFFRVLTLPADADGARLDAPGRRLPARALEPDDREGSDSFTLHDPVRRVADADDAPARPRPVFDHGDHAPARRPAAADAPAAPFDFSPLLVAPASVSASALRLELLPTGNGGGWTNGSAASVGGTGSEPARARALAAWTDPGVGDTAPAGGWTGWTANPAAGRGESFAAPAAVGPQPRIVASGTYTSVADTTTTATDQTAPFSSFTTPVISGSNVVFNAQYNSGSGMGIFTGTAGVQGAATIVDKTTTATGQSTVFSSFGTPVISGSNVAFYALYNANAGRGIFTGTVGTKGAATIADYTTTATGQSTVFSGFGTTPVISGSNVAFAATFNAGNGSGIFTGMAGVQGAATIADTTTTATGGSSALYSLSNPAISGGNVVFYATYNSGSGQGIYTGTVGTTGAATIADFTTTATGQSTAFSNFNAPFISGSNVAFAAAYNANAGRGIFTGTVGTMGAATIADYTTTATGQSTVFSSFSNPAISGGNVAFYATYNAGSGKGIFTGTVGVQGAATVADTTTTAPGRGLFTGFGTTPAISGSNVAFTATSYVTGSSGSSGNGLYLYQSGTLYDVAAVGEPLFGSTISTLGFSPSGLDGNDLTYSYTLANGVKGIGTFVAPVPEPATWLAGALLLAGAGWTLRRRVRTS